MKDVEVMKEGKSLDTKPHLKESWMLKLTHWVLITGFAMGIVAVLHPDLRNFIRESLHKDRRVVLAVAHGHLEGGSNSGSSLTVAKIKNQATLSLEVYENLTNGARRLIERIEMPDKHDGYFSYKGHLINLAIGDLDGDGLREILAPSFDRNLVGRLNVYQYDHESKGFQRRLR